MVDALQMLLWLADHEKPPCVTADCVERWSPGDLERCLAAGLLQPTAPARHLPCHWCGEIEEVVFLEDRRTKKLHAYTPCGEGGPVSVPLERLRRWEMNFKQFLDAVFAEVVHSGKREELVRGRIWRLGKTKWGGISWNVCFARGLHRRDAGTVYNQVQWTARSVIFVPARLPEGCARLGTVPVITLGEVISWEGDLIRFEHDQVEERLADALATAAPSSKNKSPLKRSSRAAIIEALTREMEDHLRGARDHAFATQDRTGIAELLPRPTMEFLARKLCVHKSTISRCLEDASARELRFLWDLAVDLDRILAHADCRT